MKTRRYSEAQIFRILKEVESGMPVVNTAREHGVSPATIHRWKARYGGLDASELRRLKRLEDENRRLKQLVAELSLDVAMLKDVASKKW